MSDAVCYRVFNTTTVIVGDIVQITYQFVNNLGVAVTITNFDDLSWNSKLTYILNSFSVGMTGWLTDPTTATLSNATSFSFSNQPVLAAFGNALVTINVNAVANGFLSTSSWAMGTTFNIQDGSTLISQNQPTNTLQINPLRFQFLVKCKDAQSNLMPYPGAWPLQYANGTNGAFDIIATPPGFPNTTDANGEVNVGVYNTTESPSLYVRPKVTYVTDGKTYCPVMITPNSQEFVSAIQNPEAPAIGQPTDLFCMPLGTQPNPAPIVVTWAFQNPAICVRDTTLVSTTRGRVPIAEVHTGDRVLDCRGQLQPVLINLFSGSSAELILIRRGALGQQQPSEDLYIRKGHPLLVNGREIEPEHLIDGHNVVEVQLDEPARLYTLCTANRTFVDMQGLLVGTWSEAALENFTENDNMGKSISLVKQ